MSDVHLLVVTCTGAVILLFVTSIGLWLWGTWRAAKRLREEAAAGGFYRHVETGGGQAGSVRAPYPLVALGVDARALHVVWMGRARPIARPELRSITVWRARFVSALRLEHVSHAIASPVVFRTWNVEGLLAQLRYYGWEFRQ